MRGRPIRRLLAVLALALAGVTLLASPAAAVSDEELREECIHILEDGGLPEDCHESPNPILPATNEIIWGALSFVVLLGILWKVALPAILKMMEERTNRIRGDLDAADRARAEAETVLADYQRQLADARTESNRIIEEARQQADQLRRDLTARAETEVAELRARGADQIGAERERVLSELRGQVAALAVELAEKVVESNLDREANLALIERYIATVGNGNRNN
jgi:F-type H+-transporting ATPase subunit b